MKLYVPLNALGRLVLRHRRVTDEIERWLRRPGRGERKRGQREHVEDRLHAGWGVYDNRERRAEKVGKVGKVDAPYAQFERVLNQ
jgi:hypothetical protein